MVWLIFNSRIQGLRHKVNYLTGPDTAAPNPNAVPVDVHLAVAPVHERDVANGVAGTRAEGNVLQVEVLADLGEVVNL